MSNLFTRLITLEESSACFLLFALPDAVRTALAVLLDLQRTPG